MIRFEHVSYTYPQAGHPALQDLSLTIAEGDFVLVVGASGSGKSTFLRCVNGLVPHFYGGHFAGRVLVNGHDTRDHEPRQLAATVGFVFQDPEAQMVVEIVEDELAFGMENLGVPRPVMRRRVEEVLDQLEIAHLRRRRVTTLSGGERQRVAIAAVLAMQPRVLVLDEPTSQLDPHAAEEVLTALQKLNADLGLTIVLSEHRLERVVQYADQLIVFEGDAAAPPIITAGPPREMLRQSPLVPPLVELGQALGWEPLPLTLKEGRRYVLSHALDNPDISTPSVIAETVRGKGLGERLWPRRAEPRRELPLPVLAAEAVSVGRGGQNILRDVSVALYSGETVALMGRNGSGKTTLLRALNGLDPVAHGRVLRAGQNITAVPAEVRAQEIGYVPQDPRALLFHETVADELIWTLKQRASTHPSTAIEERVRQTLGLLGLEHLAKAHPRDLSGGEQQRVALAAILVAEPQILLLDEPTRGLDYRHKAHLTQLLRKLQRTGRAVMIVTHDVELVAATADRIVLLGSGQVVVSGPPRELLNDSLIFSSQIGKLFRHRAWLTVEEALRGMRDEG